MVFNDESLSYMWKIEVIVELGSDPDLAGFNAPMVRRSMIDVIGLLPIPKIQFEILEKSGRFPLTVK